MRAKVAQIVTLRDLDQELRVSGANSRLINLGVSGMNGLLIFIVYIIGSLVVIATGIIITLEIYQRIFKMYVLIPFSTISFSTFVMGDGNRGNEVFHGYLKTIIVTAAEAVVIMMCVSFCYSLINSGQTMNELVDLGQVEYTVTCNNEMDVLAVIGCHEGNYQPFYEDGVSENVTSTMESMIDAGDAKGRLLVNGEEHGLVKLLGGRVPFPCVITICQACDWKVALMVALTVIFPCVLCAGAVKQASHYSGMIFGR